jgi:hypothetical protein
VPAAGWDETGFEGVVDGRRALGYATPAELADQPARIVDASPVETTTNQPSDDPTPEDVVRALGDARPPREAVSTEETSDKRDGAGQPWDAPETQSERGPPPELEAWLDDIEVRLDTADRLATAGSVEEAADAVAAVGGAADVAALDERLTADREALARVRNRCDALAGRTDRVEIPVETLARLA